MALFQEGAVDISRGVNFIPQPQRYALPNQRDGVSVYLVSNSYEYDIELVKTNPQPKTYYTHMIIPKKVVSKNVIPGKGFLYNISDQDYTKKAKFMIERKLMPPISLIKEPGSFVKDNVYIPFTDVLRCSNPFVRSYLRVDDITNKIFMFFNNEFNI